MALDTRSIGRAILAGFIFLIAHPQLPAEELRMGLITPPSHIWTQAAFRLGVELEKVSNGRYSLIIYPSRQLGNEAQMLQLMQTGALDMAILTAAEISNRVPEFGALYTPYLVKDIHEAARVLRGNVASGMLELLPEEIGVIGLGYGMGGMRQILSTLPVSTLADLQGKKLRITPFEPIKDFYQLAGVAPTPMPLSSVYDALANGQIDMIDMDLELILKLKYHELADTLIMSNHMMFPSVAMMSGRVWVRMTAEDQALIGKLVAKHMGWVIDQAVLEEAAWEEGVKHLDINILQAGPDFFGSAPEQWELIWRPRAGVIPQLRNELENARN
jgi:TRAP-type C4-dicarboxylate transport system substrate-binding protein